MSAFKQFLSQDILVEPFRVNKSFTCYSTQLTSTLYDSAVYDTDIYDGVEVEGDCLIARYLGQNIQSTPFISGSNTPTGNSSVGIQDPELIYNSIKELYYSNFLTSSYGSPVQTQSLFPGENESGDQFVGNPDSSGRYENYLQSTNDVFRKFPTGSNDKIAVLSIPSRLWGDYIQPNSFEFKITDPTDGVDYTIIDDGNGQIAYDTGGYLGNIIYTHGIVIFTNCADNAGLNEGYGTGSYGENIYGGGNLTSDDIINATNVTCSFSSSLVIYETQYKATINEFEFNFSQNPSIISGSTDGTVYNFVTGSYFSPYATTVGLYDNDQNLLAIGKLSQPLPISRTTDTTIFINIDR
jgi:hypothetical protein